MTFDQAAELAKGITGELDKRPSRFVVGKEFGGKYGRRKRVVAVLGPVSGRPVNGERGYVWVVVVNAE